MERSLVGRLALGVLVVVVLAGCVQVADDTPDVEAQLEDAEPPAELTATVETTAEFGDETLELSEEVWLRDDGTSRSESELNGTPYLTVNDGERSWSYDRERGNVSVFDVEEPFGDRMSATYEAVEEVLAELEIEETTEVTYEGRDAYRVLLEPPANETLEEALSLLVGDTVYALSTDSDEAAEDDLEDDAFERDVEHVEYWFDAKYLFPVKYAFETPEGGFEMAYRDVEFEPDPPLSDDLFEFEPPANATVDEIDLPDRQEFDDPEAAAATVAVDVREPDLPEGYAFERASVATYEDDDRVEVMLVYPGPEGQLTVEFSDDPDRFERGADGDPVDVASATGTYDRLDLPTADVHTLRWSCDGIGHYVGLSDEDDRFDRGDALEIAESVGCP